ncbi:NAD(P)/FAD-dependent oxidoreductase [Streptomyces tuirus]|uniref:NAD(P)/FAD-dependent oxidoreductase n=1 Tax=Streptomyces tuirus TaxID=68278 RepID=A0A941IZ20_9ACTN|nr:NAD(P)/FAD-dependent oxidoreductase [Streptomyces tuirus]
MYDVIVVGARCAGAPAAMLLARAGYDVLLLEKARFPRDIMSSHYIHQPGIALLDRWGLLNRLRATDAPPIDRVVYHVGDDIKLEGCSLPVDGHSSAYAPRRFVLDPILVEGAVAAGVELREGCQVTDLLFEDDRVVGVRFRTSNGGESVERARLVVGADGMRSSVARLVNAKVLVEDAPRTCTYYSYWDGLDAGFELYDKPSRWVGVIPTNGGRTLVMAYFPQSEFDAVRRAAAPAFHQNVRTTAPELYERMSEAEQAERLYGTGEQLNFLRQASGRGWALVGDAAHHKDSIAARGIMDAFIQAHLLTDRIGEDLHDESRLNKALRRYARDLDKRFMDFYQSTLSVADLRVPESKLRMFRAISGDQELVDRYFATLSGAIDVKDFYNAQLLAKLE